MLLVGSTSSNSVLVLLIEILGKLTGRLSTIHSQKRGAILQSSLDDFAHNLILQTSKLGTVTIILY